MAQKYRSGRFTNKDMARAIAASTNMPIKEAEKIIKVVLAYWVKEIREKKRVRIPELGWFKQLIWHRNPWGEKINKYTIKYKSINVVRKWAINDPQYKLEYQGYKLRRLIFRSIDAGDMKDAKRRIVHLKKYISDKPRVEAWLRKWPHKGHHDEDGIPWF